VNKLPNWILTHRFPSVYDSESKTAIEQTARVYGAMNDLIEEYNKYVESLNKEIALFETGVVSTQECFRNNITKVMNEFIESVDKKIILLESHLKTNIRETLTTWIEEGSLDDTIMNSFENLKSRVEVLEQNANAVVYNAETESLDLAEV
jgi:phage shock protein A